MVAAKFATFRSAVDPTFVAAKCATLDATIVATKCPA